MEKEENRISRKGGVRRIKNADVKIIVTSKYVGDKPMAEVIGNAIIDSYMRHADLKGEIA